MKENIFLLDIDKTIIDPKIFLRNFGNKLEDLEGWEQGKTYKIYENYIKELESSTDFYPEEFIKRVSDKSDISQKDLNDIFYSPDMWEDAIYPEVYETLSKLKEQGASLGTYSEGYAAYQFSKLRLTNIQDFFDKNLIFISRRKLDDNFINGLFDQLGRITIVDDKKEVVEKLNASNRCNIIWVNRKTDEKMEGVATIKNLNELFYLPESRQQELSMVS